MTEHDEIRDLLALAVARALDPDEEERVERHLRSCAACAAELDDWQLLAGGLRRLPTPQPSPAVVERARARAEIRFVEEAEHRSHRTVLIFLTLFAWAITLMGWPVVQLLTGGLLGWFSPRFSQGWLGFAAFSTLAWAAGGTAALLLAFHQQRERSTA
jgi:anti-sigma factor RsiW